MARNIFGYIRALVIASTISALAFATPPLVYAATTPPPVPTSLHPCVSAAGVLSVQASCHAALEAARAKWPDARLALDGVGSGNGSFIVPSPDGAHFDEVTNIVTLTSRHSAGGAVNGRSTAAFSLVQDVYALGLAYSNSGSVGATAYPCGTMYDWYGNVFYNTYFGGHAEMDTKGYLDRCAYAVTTNITPVFWGAGSWTERHGAGGNGTWTTNPWMDSYASFWGCCSDTVLLRLYMNGNGYWSVDVYQ